MKRHQKLDMIFDTLVEGAVDSDGNPIASKRDLARLADIIVEITERGGLASVLDRVSSDCIHKVE